MIPNVVLGEIIDPDWGNAVANQLNKIVYGTKSATTDASGYVTVTHGAGFTPIAVLVTVNSATAAQVYVDAISATTFRVRLADVAGVFLTTDPTQFGWMALG